jgi:curved DNA-binding protein
VGAGRDRAHRSTSREAEGPIPGADQEFELELSVDDAYKGVQRWLTIAGPEGTRSAEVTIPPGVTQPTPYPYSAPSEGSREPWV